ncbi:Lipopolysaccharide-induced tumor necrosis factor-alpha factor [Orchesella cincta]|uniref:Lipopolysaccharide-induced tumor necrosis factor-alpha factor n=1 Tax=Orchesella cincta TaxID=48709 RepID=A0A1D2MH28_ORCCI|nr:Lipopolysaccharide-induced tumor necrosis factor-alpha factor [Orchesella cincta]
MSAPPLYPDPSGTPQKAYPPPYDAGMQQGAAPPPGFYQPPVQAAPYQPQPQAAPVLMVGQTQPQVVVVGTTSLGTHKARITCRNCRNEIQTSTDKKPSIFSWISAGVLCIFGCVCGCCLIPFCVDSCMDTHHSCPNCGAHLGTHRAF